MMSQKIRSNHHCQYPSYCIQWIRKFNMPWIVSLADARFQLIKNNFGNKKIVYWSIVSLFFMSFYDKHDLDTGLEIRLLPSIPKNSLPDVWIYTLHELDMFPISKPLTTFYMLSET